MGRGGARSGARPMRWRIVVMNLIFTGNDEQAGVSNLDGAVGFRLP